MLIQISDTKFYNLNEVILISGIFNSEDDVHIYSIGDDGFELTSFDREKLIDLITNKMPQIVRLGNDFVNLEKIVKIDTEDYLDIYFSMKDDAFSYDEDEVSLRKKKDFLSLFNMESVWVEEDSEEDED